MGKANSRKEKRNLRVLYCNASYVPCSEVSHVKFRLLLKDVKSAS